ncbi:radical SAM protein [uncultured Parabacteroides sp.]|uniref:radical SAM protein n=2 Tax=uncultured Parabacteroides sp. TaxID=512312 RepID=UPI00265A8A84|nr:radical SAM protein [uncultured Parabacteroides sp.]
MATKIPKSVVLELTYRCNHKCLFCSCPWYVPNSSYNKGRELSLDEWQQAILKLYNLEVETFSISGGEALLKENLAEILTYIREEGDKRGLHYPIVLISNGRIMNENWLLLFKKLDVQLSMSLPGYSTFAEHTQVDNADGVLYWFSKAKEIGVNAMVNVTVTKKNYKELFETISLGLIHGADGLLLNRFLPGGRGLEYIEELSLSNEQLNGMLDTAEEILSLSNRYGHVGTEIAFCSILDPRKYKRLGIGYQCAAAKGFFVVGPSGEIRICNHSPKIVGHIFAQNLITDVDYWNLFADSSYKPKGCSLCHRVSSCDCGCREVAHIINGDATGVDPSLRIRSVCRL